MTKVKICGLKRTQDVEIVNKYQPDYIGFVFAKSKRQISLEKAETLKALLNPDIKSLGVFVNEPIQSILECERHRVIDIIQLHGDEDLTYINQLKEVSSLPIVKAFRIKDEESLIRQKWLIEHPILDGILLDAYHPTSYGGIGESFDWKVLNQIDRPYFLAGGIGKDNIEEALLHQPYAIDVSSKVETDGCKDEEKVKSLIEAVRQYKMLL